jgi:hypothetical protein
VECTKYYVGRNECSSVASSGPPDNANCRTEGMFYHITNSPICEGCYKETNSLTEPMDYEYKALHELRFRYLGKHFVKISHYYEIPLSKILCFVEVWD